MKFIRIIVLAFAICLFALLVGCGENETGTSNSSERGSGEKSAYTGDSEADVGSDLNESEQDEQGKTQSYEILFAEQGGSGMTSDTVINKSSDSVAMGEYKIIKTYYELCQLVGDDVSVEEGLFDESYVLYISRWYNNYWCEEYSFKSFSFSENGAIIESEIYLYGDELERVVSPMVTHYEDYIVIEKTVVSDDTATQGTVEIRKNYVKSEADLSNDVMVDTDTVIR